MKLLVCPECKEVISETNLHGTNPNCLSCRYRVSTDDLVELDTAKAIDAQRQGASPGYDPYGIGNMIQRGVSASMGEQSVPVIHSLSELPLRLGMFWEQNGDGYRSSQTLVIKSKGMISMLIFALVWLGFTVPFIGFMLYSFLHDPSSMKVNGHPGHSSDLVFILIFPIVFWGVGLGMLYASIMSCFSKTWIDIDRDQLYIERGLFRSGKKKVIRRSAQTEVSMYSNASMNHQPIFAVKLIDDMGGKVKVAGGLDRERASEVVYLFKTLLRAEL